MLERCHKIAFLFMIPLLFIGKSLASDLGKNSAIEELSRVKRQIANLLEMKLPEKMQDLQEELQTLRGSIEKQNSDITELKEKLNETSQKLEAYQKSTSGQDKTATKKLEQVSTITYEKAITAIREKRYPDAQHLLIQYLAAHPNDKLAGSAHFWLGEVYYQQNKKNLAKREFEIIKKQYPTHTKIPPTLLKLAYLELQEENFGKAKEIFNHIIKKYPNTPSAHLAKIKLKR